MIRWTGLVCSAGMLILVLHSPASFGNIAAGISAGLLFILCATTLVFGREVTAMDIGEIKKEVTFEPMPEDVPVPEIVPEPVVEPEKEPANV